MKRVTPALPFSAELIRGNAYGQLRTVLDGKW